jgi:hypothetical protein
MNNGLVKVGAGGLAAVVLVGGTSPELMERLQHEEESVVVMVPALPPFPLHTHSELPVPPPLTRAVVMATTSGTVVNTLTVGGMTVTLIHR